MIGFPEAVGVAGEAAGDGGLDGVTTAEVSEREEIERAGDHRCFCCGNGGREVEFHRHAGTEEGFERAAAGHRWVEWHGETVFGLTMDSGKPECGVDLEVDEFARCFLVSKPFPDNSQGDMMHEDVLACNPTARVFPDEVFGMKKVGAFRSHAG